LTGKGHKIVGLIVAIGTFKYSLNLDYNYYVSFIAAVFTFFGSTAPDDLEIRRKVYDGGVCVGTRTVIPHRTITHWVLAWVLFFIFSNSFFTLGNSGVIGESYLLDTIDLTYDYLGVYYEYIFAGLVGYSIGGILHLIVDIPNKKPIPIFTLKDKLALHLWKSGKYENLIIAFFVVVVAWYCGIIEFVDYEKIIPS